MTAQFTIERATGSQYLFNLEAENGEIVFTSENYTSKQNAQNGIDAVRSQATADENYRRGSSTDGQEYFVLVAANGETLGRSEMYRSHGALEKGIQSVKTNAPTAEVVDLTKQ